MWRRGKNSRWILLGIGMMGFAVPHGAVDAADGPWSRLVVPWFEFSDRVVQRSGMATPTEAIKELDRLLGSYRTGASLTAADREYNRQLKQRILTGTFDIRELCRIALAEHWAVRSADEREYLVDLMTSLMEERAVTSKEQTAEKSRSTEIYRVRYVGEKFLDPQRGRALVLTVVTIPSKNITIHIEYKLQRSAAAWKIFDVVVDGSSLVENYAYQFDSIITEHGYEELIRRMERKLDEMRADKRS